MKKLLVAFGLFCSLLIAAPAWAFDVTLAWEASPSQDIKDYVVYWDTSSGTPKANSQAVGTDLEYTITDLTDGTMTYFHVIAVDWEGRKSGPSNEVRTDGIVTPDSGTDPVAPGGCYIKSVTP